jgi:glycosyltransferase involved in cell wall biosynthesis
MRLGINGRFLSARRITGVERVAHEVARRMLESERHDVLCFADASRAHAFAGERGVPVAMGAGALRRHLWEQCQLPELARRLGVQWLYNPINTAPVAVRDQVVVIHDAAFLSPNASQTLAFRTLYTQLATRLVQTARGIVTVSEFSRGELIERLGARPEQVRVVPNGVSPHFRPQPADGVRRAHGLPPDYVLYVGSLEPRKNLRVLLQALRLLAERRRLEGHRLVLVGCRGANFQDDGLATAIAQAGERVQVLGYVPDHDLPALYAGATAFVYPSLYEGFGLPPLEAMACGAPVIASAAAAIPEVVGDAGLLFPPHDAEALADALARLIADASLRGELSRRGLARAAHFSWDQAAQRTLAFMEELAS